jgi:hypothetical protein
MTNVIKDNNFKEVSRHVKPDIKKRVCLPKTLVQSGIVYRILHNSAGQILLDPQVTIPASELWLFKNKGILESIDKGMAESAKRRTTSRGSFAKYVKNAT